MRVQPDSKSPWGRRVWIPDDEFETAMDDLRVEGCFARGTGVDVDAILLARYQVTPDFGDVAESCLGRTRFEPDGSYSVLISRALSDESVQSKVARRRLRSTLAHELAHIVFHGILHPIHLGPLLFPDLAPPQPFLCRPDISKDPTEKGPWWEYQANRGMSCLLMPRDLVRQFLTEAVAKRSLADMREALAASRGKAVIQDLMEDFDVSLELALYRLQGLGYIPQHVGQDGLTF
jgi:hypothetical protein